ncbi:MAG: ABC transporter ATP-binding protein [Microbacteriaceae bacterium]
MKYSFQALALLTPRERNRYIRFVLLSAVLSVLDVAGIALIGFIVTAASAVVVGSQYVQIFSLSFAIPTRSQFVWLIVFVLAAFILKAVFGLLTSHALSRSLAQVDSRMAAEVTQFFAYRPVAELSHYSLAQVEWSIVEAVSRAFSQSLFSLAAIFSNGILIVLVFVAFLFTSPVLAIVIVGYFALFFVGFEALVRRRQHAAGVLLQRGTSRTKETITDLMGSLRELTVSGRRAPMVDRLLTEREHVSFSQARQRVLNAAPRYFVETGLIVGVISLLGWQLVNGLPAQALSISAVLLAGGVRMMGAVLPIQQALGTLRANAATSSEVIELVGHVRLENSLVPDSVYDIASSSNSFAAPASIQFTDVSLTYPNTDTAALSSVSFRIEPGTQVALIGKSGSGKTTTADLILGLLQPSRGTVLIDGVPAEQALSDVSPRMAYVPQRPVLIQGTLRENLALGVPHEQIDDTRIAEIVEFAGLNELVRKLPHGVNTVINQRLDHFSGGEVQRISLARALYAPPQLLVLDEATSALDAHTESIVTSNVEQLRGSVTVVVIAHRLSTVQRADSILYLDSGQLRAQGNMRELRAAVPEVERLISLMAISEEPSAGSL